MTRARVIDLFLGVAVAAAVVVYVIAPYRATTTDRSVSAMTDLVYRNQRAPEAWQMATANESRARAAIEDYPYEVKLYVSLAANLRMLGNASEAHRWYERAIEVQPGPDIYVSMGENLMQMGRSNEARAAFEKAIAFDPRLKESLEPMMR